MIVLALTLAVGAPASLARPVYVAAVIVAVVAALITSWFVVTASDAEITSGLVPEGVLEDDSLLRALGAALVLLAALWFGALAASRIEEQVTVTEE